MEKAATERDFYYALANAWKCYALGQGWSRGVGEGTSFISLIDGVECETDVVFFVAVGEVEKKDNMRIQGECTVRIHHPGPCPIEKECYGVQRDGFDFPEGSTEIDPWSMAVLCLDGATGKLMESSAYRAMHERFNLGESVQTQSQAPAPRL